MASGVSAGDVGRYAYCALNWKRSLEGKKGEGGKRGIREHEALSESVDALETYQSHARLTQDTALLLALFAMSAAALAVEFFALRQDTAWWWILILLSVVWAAASLYLVVFNLYYKSRASHVRGTKIAKGEVAFSDSRRHEGVFASKVVQLRGRPDYVVETESGHVPVELKTGRTPRQPYDSHVLQLAAYCYLVGEHYGRRPTHGILTYPERKFEVPYTLDLEDRLLKTLLRIQYAEHTGDVHRDHDNPRRCAGCSRREGCPERLD